jgi:hypothetical protein
MFAALRRVAAPRIAGLAAGWDRVAALPPALLLAVLCSIFVGLSLWEMHDESVTTDELVHLSSGWTYLARGDFRLNTEHPILAKALAALPLQLMTLHWPTTDDWKLGRQWQFGFHFLFTSGNDADRILFWSRLFMLPWGLLLIASIYGIARPLFGPPGALVSAVLATFFPLFLGHAHLVTTDVPVAAMMLLSAWGFGTLADRPTLVRSLLCGVLFGVALMVKYSAVLLLPPMLWFLATRWIPPLWRSRRESGSTIRRDILVRTGSLLVVGAVSLMVIWVCYGFRYRAAREPGFELEWRFERTEHSAVGKTLATARRYRILPEAYLHGFWYMFENAQSRSAFACGLRSPVGWWWYFPFAFLVKTPVVALLLLLGGFIGALVRRADGPSPTHFLVIPTIMYWVITCAGNIMIGLRHLMPVFPMMIVLAGGTLARRDGGEPGPGRKAAMAALLALLGIEVLLAGPYYLAYFNAPSTAVAPPHEMLTDSNLDWGQDLARLRKWMDREGLPTIKLAYFGNDSCRYRHLKHERLMAANMYQQYEPEWAAAGPLQGGDWIAVGATNYSGVVLGENYDYYRLRLGDLKPTTTIGHSILVYHLPERWAPPPNVPR